MTVGEVIERVQELMPSHYTPEMLASWLCSLDGKINEEVIKTHDRGCRSFGMPIYDGSVYDEDTLLLVPPPYCDDVYTYYLMAQIASHNAETMKYNQYITLYNSAYDQYTTWYNRTHMPLTRGRFMF